MAYYRLYHIQESHFFRFDDFEADDDAYALQKAKRLNGEGNSELWSGKRRIAVLKPASG